MIDWITFLEKSKAWRGKGRVAMNTKTCPMCGGEQFYLAWTEGIPSLRLGLLNWVRVHSAVCLGCGFVAPSVDARGLAAIQATATREGIEIGGKPAKQDIIEV
jgi:hypothetical protein